MKSVKLLHQETKEIIASDIKLANMPWSRVKGLLFSKKLNEGCGLWLIPCNAVHMLGMQYAIDLVFLDKKNHVIHTISQLQPNKISPIIPKAHSVIELPAGFLAQHPVALQDTLIAA